MLEGEDGRVKKEGGAELTAGNTHKTLYSPQKTEVISVLKGTGNDINNATASEGTVQMLKGVYTNTSLKPNSLMVKAPSPQPVSKVNSGESLARALEWNG